MNRRQFLQVTALASLPWKMGHTIEQPLLYSAVADDKNRMFISGINIQGTAQFRTQLPARAHAVSLRDKHQELIVFARRPGQYLLILDAQSGEIKQQISPSQSRAYYGHGLFSTDQNTLFCTENNYEELSGVIGIYDASNHYQKIGEYSSGGIGPHELVRYQNTLIVANGGILTHPDTGASKLNLNSMQPNLSYIDINSGKQHDTFELKQSQRLLSIRHLEVNNRGQVCFAMQYQGPRKHHLPLIGFHRGETSLQLADMPKSALLALNNYCGSVATDRSGDYFAVTSPRGHRTSFWRSDGQYLHSSEMKDVCGVCATSTTGEFYLSSGEGKLIRESIISKEYEIILDASQLRWDNHMTSI